jgi:hypothetical protein
LRFDLHDDGVVDASANLDSIWIETKGLPDVTRLRLKSANMHIVNSSEQAVGAYIEMTIYDKSGTVITTIISTPTFRTGHTWIGDFPLEVGDRFRCIVWHAENASSDRVYVHIVLEGEVEELDKP